MNRFLNLLLAGLLIGATALVAPLTPARAQSRPEPAVIISIADIASQLKDTDYLVEAAGFPEMKFISQTMIKQYTKGINAKSPAGLMLYFVDGVEVPEVLGFVPVSNLDDLLDTISGMAEVDEGEDFTKIVTDDGTELFVKQVGELAFLSNNKEMFDELPSNPAELLGDMPTKYNLSAKVFGQRIPQSLRDQAIAAIKEGYEKQLELLGENEPVQAELQRNNFDFQMKQFEMYLNQTESITLGMAADKEAQSLYTDFALTALAGSEMAKRFSGSKSAEQSLFKGFLIEGAAFTQNLRVNVLPEEAVEYETVMANLRKTVATALQDETDFSEEDSKIAEKAVNDVLDVIQSTINEGVLDSGAVLMLNEGEINMATGFTVADSKKLEETIKELVAVAEEKLAGELQVELNSGSHKDVTFHRLVIDVPDDAEEVRDVIGDQVTVIIGIGPKSVYLGAGSNPLPLIKQAMDSTGPSEDTPAMQYNFYLAPILKFAASIEGNPMVEKMAAELVANKKDRINVVSKFVDNGLTMRFEIQDGILALIKVGMDNLGAGGFPGGENEF